MRSGLALVAVVAAFTGTLFFGGRALGVWDGPLPGASAASADDEAEPGAVPLGWTLHRVSDAGFALALPVGWETFRPRDARPSADGLVRARPELEPYVKAVLGGRDPAIKFLAVESGSLAAGRGPMGTNVNVAVSPGGRPPKAAAALVKKVLGIRGRVEHRWLTLPAGEALQLRYRWRPYPRGVAVVVTQYIFWRRGIQYVVSFGTIAAKSESYEAVFRESVETFRFLQPPPEKKAQPAAHAAEARWIRQANAICRRAFRDLGRSPTPRTPEEVAEVLETLEPLNRRYNAAFLAIPAPPSFTNELRKLRRLFERDERLVARFVAAARERDSSRVAEVVGKLAIVAQKESAIMGDLGADDCDVHGFGGAT